jgi:fructose-1,6-bisphosphatase
MDIEPKTIHERTPFIIGSRSEVAEFDQMQNAARTRSFAETATD